MVRTGLLRVVVTAMLLQSANSHAACEQTVQTEYVSTILGWVVGTIGGGHAPPNNVTSPQAACDAAMVSTGGRVCTDEQGHLKCVPSNSPTCPSSAAGLAQLPYCPAGYDWAGMGAPGDCLRAIVTPSSRTISLINEAGQTRPGFLAEVEPNIPDVNVFGAVRPGNGIRSQAPLRARVTCDGGQPAPGVQVQFTVDVVDRSGGHDHVDGRHVFPNRGQARLQHAFTDAEGYVNFTFHAPVAAGDHTISAECPNAPCGRVDERVWVGVQDLVSLYDTHLYRLVGSIQPHTRNHFLTFGATGNLVWLAEQYRSEFPVYPVLHLNDASLERGGIFDLKSNWQPSHHSHRQGLAIDMVANPAVNPGLAIPAGNFERFEEMARDTGWWANLELPGTTIQHFHAEFELSCFPANSEAVDAAVSIPPPGGGSPPTDPNQTPQ